MAHAIRLSDLATMTEGERTALIGQVAKEAGESPNGHATAALARIRAFEKRYEIQSDRLLDALAAGSVRETAEIAEWLFWMHLLNRTVEPK